MAVDTRHTVKKNSVKHLPNEIITHSPTRMRKKNMNDILSMQNMKMIPMETTSMETRQLNSSQKETIKKIAEFSGKYISELDIDEWLFDLTNLFSLMKLKDESRILETKGKLTGSALRWYQENLRSFTNWENTEKAL